MSAHSAETDSYLQPQGGGGGGIFSWVPGCSEKRQGEPKPQPRQLCPTGANYVSGPVNLDMPQEMKDMLPEGYGESKAEEGTLYHHVLPDEVEYSWVLVLPNDEHKRWGYDEAKKKEIQAAREKIIVNLRGAGLALKIHSSCDKDEFFVMIGAPQRFLEFVGTRMGINCKKVFELEAGVEEKYQPFNMFDVSQFKGSEKPGEPFKFRSKDRLEIIESIIRDIWNPALNKFGAELDIDALVDIGHILYFYPRHNPKTLDRLAPTWARFSLMYDMANGIHKQPYNAIRDYFGEKIAMYFRFIGFYTAALVVPASWGFLSGIVYYIFYGHKTLGYVAEWAVVLYCLQVASWACTFLEGWKREESKMAYDWGMRGLDAKEQPLPSFKGKYDSILETFVYDDAAEGTRYRRKVCNGFFVALSTFLVGVLMAAFVMLQNWLQHNFIIDGVGMGWLASVGNAAAIIICNEIYKVLAESLCDAENYRTETEYFNSLIFKRFTFQFVNSYFSLYLTAFLKPFAEVSHKTEYNGMTYNNTGPAGNTLGDYFGTCSCKTKEWQPSNCYQDYDCTDNACSNMPYDLCHCEEFACPTDVGYLLLALFGVQIVVGNIAEVVVPRIQNHLKEKYENENNQDKYIDEVEKEALLPDYDKQGLFDDYNEMVLQFGFVTLFATNFPFVGLLAFLNNIIEIRSDAYKLCHIMRRPGPAPAENIGAWYYVMELMSFAAVTTNCATIFMVSDLTRDMAWTYKILFLFLAEHVAFCIKLIYQVEVPDNYPEVQRAIEKDEAVEYKKLVEDLVQKMEHEYNSDLSEYRNVDVDPMDVVGPAYFTYKPFPVKDPSVIDRSATFIPGKNEDDNEDEFQVSRRQTYVHGHQPDGPGTSSVGGNGKGNGNGNGHDASPTSTSQDSRFCMPSSDPYLKTDDEANRKVARPGELLYKHVLDSDLEYCWVMVFPYEEHEKWGFNPEKKIEVRQKRELCMLRMLRAGLALKKHISCDGDEIFILIGAPQHFLEFVATRMSVPCKAKKEVVVREQDGSIRSFWEERYLPFDMFKKENYIGAEKPGQPFRFRSKTRIAIIESVITDVWAVEFKKYGAGIDVDELCDEGSMIACFPRHEQNKLNDLHDNWAQLRLAFNFDIGFVKQPYDDIRDYFGEKIALYFSFMGFYTYAMARPMVFGILCGVVYEVFYRYKGLEWIAEVAVILYCLQVAAWACRFLEDWKREQSKMAHSWGMRGLDAKEQPLPSFQDDNCWASKFDVDMDTFVYNEERLGSIETTRRLHLIVVFLNVVLVAVVMIGFVMLQQWLELNFVIAGVGMGWLASVANALAIILFNELNNVLSEFLCDREYFRTETEYYNSLIFKRFTFQFVNSYFALYLTAFLKPFAEVSHKTEYNGMTYNNTGPAGNTLGDYFGTCTCKEASESPSGCFEKYDCVDYACSNIPYDLCHCEEFSCPTDVGYLLLTLFGVQIFIGNVAEVLVPRIQHYLQERYEAEVNADKYIDEVEKEALLPDYDKQGLFDDYNEMVLQFGFVTLFATNFPFVALLAFLNNIIEIRSDAYKIVHVMRRPGPAPAENIGSWYWAMELMSFAAVTTNSATIFLVNPLTADMAWTSKILFLFIAEHVAFVCKLLYQVEMPDNFPEIQRAIDQEEAMANKELVQDLLDEMDRKYSSDLAEYRDPKVMPPKTFEYTPFPEREPREAAVLESAKEPKGPAHKQAGAEDPGAHGLESTVNRLSAHPGRDMPPPKLKPRQPLATVTIDASDVDVQLTGQQQSQGASYTLEPSATTGKPVPTASI